MVDGCVVMLVEKVAPVTKLLVVPVLANPFNVFTSVVFFSS